MPALLLVESSRFDLQICKGPLGEFLGHGAAANITVANEEQAPGWTRTMLQVTHCAAMQGQNSRFPPPFHHLPLNRLRVSLSNRRENLDRYLQVPDVEVIPAFLSRQRS